MKKVLLLVFIFCANYLGIVAQTGIAVPSMAHCDVAMQQFMNTYQIPGATFALAKDGELKYMRAFGHADLAKTEATQPYHMFRIASLSKPITSITIMHMVEKGLLRLDDKVFGPGSIMENDAYFGLANITDNRTYDITIQHLLEHSGGWDRDVACTTGAVLPYSWSLPHCDPIGFPLHVSLTFNESNPVSREALVRFVLEKGLNFTPGTQYAYSNMGYLLLGLVIEKKTGMSYETYVKQTILDPIGACDMYIGKNLQADKREREGEYEGNGFNVPSCYGTGVNVPWEYGGWNLEAMGAHGGWIATARDLVCLINAVDGFSSRPDILSASTINTMTTPSVNASYYAKGWSVNQFNNWWHTGALDGTASIMVRSSGGYTFAIILNKRIIDNRSSAFWTTLDNLPWDCLSNTQTWPAHDLFEMPLLSSSSLTFDNGTATSFDVNWLSGNGQNRIVVMREGQPVSDFPLDGNDYTAQSIFGQGDDLGNGSYIVYNGAGSKVNVSGLTTGKTYHVRIFDYNQNNATGNYALYQRCSTPQGSASPSPTLSLHQDIDTWGIQVFPNPVHDVLHLHVPAGQGIDQVICTDPTGKHVWQKTISEVEIALPIQGFSSQVYQLTFFQKGAPRARTRFIKF